jgi:C-terminal peptidase prc
MALLQQHVTGKDLNALERQTHSDEGIKRLLEHFYKTLDPYGIFLYHSEYEEETNLSSIAAVRLYLNDKSNCQIFEEKYVRLRQALIRHIQSMRSAFSDTELLFKKVQGLTADREAFNKALADLPPFPQNENDLVDKAITILAANYLNFRDQGADEGTAFRTALKVVRQIRASYEFHDPNSIYSVIAKSLIKSYDIHSNYFTPQEYEDFLADMSAGFAGLGIEVGEDERGIRVLKIIADGPAAKQNLLREGDIIVSIDSDTKTPLGPLKKSVLRLRGDEGTSLTLDVLREGQLVEGLLVKRGIVESKKARLNSEVVEIEGMRLGYLAFDSFYSPFRKVPGVAVDIQEKLRTMKQENVSGLVVDLRGNGGGSLNEVKDLAGQFISVGPVVSIVGDSKLDKILVDHNNSFLFDKPLVVLVDGGSASASEIFAGVIQDYNRGLVVGAKHTFGKGSVQRINALSDLEPPSEERGQPIRYKLSGGVKLTRQFYYLPSGRSPQFSGVLTDITFPEMDISNNIESKLNPLMVQPAPFRNFFMTPIVGLKYGKWHSDDFMMKAKQHFNTDIELTKMDPKERAIEVLRHWIEMTKPGEMTANLEKLDVRP